MTDQPKWAIVPVEATDEMLIAGAECGYDASPRDHYEAMLAAAPPPPAIVEALELIADEDSWLDANPEKRQTLGDRGRAYAETARAALAQWYGRDKQ
jgi:hypothetical protein